VKTNDHWKPIGFYPHHGISLALSSLHTKQSCGIGEFLDLIPLIDWCKELKLDCIQLLPINDTGNDASPYNPLSSCALDPVFLSFSDLGLSSEPFAHLKAQQRVLRHEVLSIKIELLRKLFEDTFLTLSKTVAYRTFLVENPWLESYSLFKALKEQFGGKNWIDWPTEYSMPEQSKIDFYPFLQFHCFSQMGKVRAHATQQGVFLKGDIPILLSPDSDDVWAHRNLFHLDFDAGAPPDYYNSQGQHWGFPLFNWDAMRQTHFTWWKQRLKVAEKQFHIYRIDHVVGFFRIWGIPKGKKPTEGSFFPPDHNQWFPQGKELLEMMLDATPLLPIAEDLGTIPKEVYPILKELGICGTKVVRWQRREHDGHYIPFNEYDSLSMTTLSTADMDPLELWWKKYPAESVPFAQFMGWSYHPILTQKQRLHILTAVHHTSSLFHINLLQEYLALFPELVSLNPEEERINHPGTLLPTNWTYKFRPSLEEIISHLGLKEAFKQIIK